ncbi:hypothetical protein ACFLZQ_02665 [Thermodesulfobacteriota bacterium]
MKSILLVFISTLVLFHSVSVGWSVAGEEAVTVSSAELKELKAQIEALQKKFQELSEKQVAADERVAITQEEQKQQDVSKEEVEKYKEVKKAAKKEKVEKAAKQDATGTDPRVFSDKWMPYYRYTKLENGLTQQDLTAFGTMRFSDRVGMFYELPLAQYRDLSDVPGPPPAGTDAIGMGDIDLKFLWRPEALEFSYGKEGKMSASVLLGTDFLLPTATDDLLGGNALLFAPIVAFVFDMPLHGFVAALNLYFFDVYKDDSAPKTSRYVGKWFYMQPLTKPGPWWGGLFLLPEFQPIYDFETDDFSAWIGVEFGKMLAPGRIAYVKPGWGVNNSEETDRESTFEVGYRWFF